MAAIWAFIMAHGRQAIGRTYRASPGRESGLVASARPAGDPMSATLPAPSRGLQVLSAPPNDSDIAQLKLIHNLTEPFHPAFHGFNEGYPPVRQAGRQDDTGKTSARPHIRDGTTLPFAATVQNEGNQCSRVEDMPFPDDSLVPGAYDAPLQAFAAQLVTEGPERLQRRPQDGLQERAVIQRVRLDVPFLLRRSCLPPCTRTGGMILHHLAVRADRGPLAPLREVRP